MSEWTPAIWLMVQAILTIVAFEFLRLRVLPALHHLREPELVLDVWGPLALIIPMLFFISRIHGNVRGVGWIAIGGPVICGLFGLGAAMMLGGFARPFEDWRDQLMPRLTWAATGAGIVLLMLGSAHYLTLWMGQCAFALGAVLMWMNTPELGGPHANEPQAAGQLRAGLGMSIVLLCAVGQGIASKMTSQHYSGLSGSMMIAGAAMNLVVAARLAGPFAAIRIGLWAATYGVLMGLGLLSLLRLLPEALHIMKAGNALPVDRIAFGFGAYGLEAVAMLLLAGIAMVQTHLDLPLRRVLGGIIFLFAALLAAWRLDSM